MKPETFEEYMVELSTFPFDKHHRKGQRAFNYLYEVRPDIADKISGTYSDPFYNDGALDDFFVLVAGMWDQKEVCVKLSETSIGHYFKLRICEIFQKGSKVSLTSLEDRFSATFEVNADLIEID